MQRQVDGSRPQIAAKTITLDVPVIDGRVVDRGRPN
jgi:hypothetical protein